MSEITIDDARRFIEEDRRQRKEQCLREIEAILEKYGCNLVGRPYVTSDGRLAANSVLTDRDVK